MLSIGTFNNVTQTAFTSLERVNARFEEIANQLAASGAGGNSQQSTPIEVLREIPDLAIQAKVSTLVLNRLDELSSTLLAAPRQ